MSVSNGAEFWDGAKMAGAKGAGLEGPEGATGAGGAAGAGGTARPEGAEPEEARSARPEDVSLGDESLAGAKLAGAKSEGAMGADGTAGADQAGASRNDEGNEAWSRRYAAAVMNTFGAPQRVLVRGEGTRVWDADGRQYLDLLAGIAVNCLGHAHPAIVAAVAEQLATLGHVSNFFTTPAQVRLAEELGALVFPDSGQGTPEEGRLGDSGRGRAARAPSGEHRLDGAVGATGPAGATAASQNAGSRVRGVDHGRQSAQDDRSHHSAQSPAEPRPHGAVGATGPAGPQAAPGDVKVFLANSGAEANEAAFKIARRHGGASRPRILALESAFHGRTMGSLAVTHKAAYREPFEPLPGGVEFLPAGDADALRRTMGPDVAALFVEPIQGEAGVRELSPGYLREARALTAEAGALLVVDEVQTGMGRTGAWMAHHLLAPGVVPDVVTLAKGLGGGMPIGAVVARGDAAALLGPGQHGTTFGGNPVACSAALAVIETIRGQGLLERVRQLGSRWAEQLAHVPGVAEVRGRGLLIGVGLAEGVAPAAEVAGALLERGFIVNAPDPRTIRLAPPFILTDDEAAALTGALAEVLAGKAVSK